MRMAAPDPLRHSHPLAVVVGDLMEQRSAGAVYPPGELGFSLARTKRFYEEPCALLVAAYERFGPVFTVRTFHRKSVFMIGPAANHYVTVTNAANFTMRESAFRDLIALVGDSLLTTDGDYHRRSRGLVMPAFHRESIASYFDAMIEEVERALDGIVPGESIELYAWSRRLVRRTVMRALFDLDPDGERMKASGLNAMFDQLYTMTPLASLTRAPFTSWARLMRDVRTLDSFIYGEIAERRERGAGGSDILSLLTAARDEDGEALTDRQIRDEVVTLLLAGLETTASSLTFLVYELARHPEVADRIVAELRESLEGGRPSWAQLAGEELPELGMAIDETLRMYPSVWIGPRRATEAFEFEGVTVPAGAYVHYCPLASHNLPHVFPEPERFQPERFTPEAKAALPKGAYVPFGGGSRKCIGMRFAQIEIRVAAALLLQRFQLDLPADFSLSVGTMPMLMPKDGMPVILSERAALREQAPAVSG